MAKEIEDPNLARRFPPNKGWTCCPHQERVSERNTLGNAIEWQGLMRLGRLSSTPTIGKQETEVGSPKLHQDPVSGPSVQEEGGGSPQYCNDNWGLPVGDDNSQAKEIGPPSVVHGKI